MICKIIFMKTPQSSKDILEFWMTASVTFLPYEFNLNIFITRPWIWRYQNAGYRTIAPEEICHATLKLTLTQSLTLTGGGNFPRGQLSGYPLCQT